MVNNNLKMLVLCYLWDEASEYLKTYAENTWYVRILTGKEQYHKSLPGIDGMSQVVF